MLEAANEASVSTRSEPPVTEIPAQVFVPEMTLLPDALMRIPAPEMSPEREITEVVEPVSVRLVPLIVTAPVLVMS